jgi:hypothetical protein
MASAPAYSADDKAAIVLSFTARTMTELDGGLGAGGTAGRSWGALLSDDGSTAVFTHRNGPFGCTACTNVFAARVGSAPELASPAVNGTPSTTGDSQAVAVSPNGRFVLFQSTSTDLAGGHTNTEGHLYVRDLVNDTSDELPVPLADPWTPRPARSVTTGSASPSSSTAPPHPVVSSSPRSSPSTTSRRTR